MAEFFYGKTLWFLETKDTTLKELKILLNTEEISKNLVIVPLSSTQVEPQDPQRLSWSATTTILTFAILLEEYQVFGNQKKKEKAEYSAYFP